MSFSSLNKLKQSLIGLFVLFILISGFIISLYGQSEFSLNANDLLEVITVPDSQNIKQQVILSLRLPRSLVACLIGFNLAVAGLLMQGLTRNPLASPTLFAINSGATCLVAFNSIGLGLFTNLPIEIVTFLGGLLGGLSVFLLGGGFRKNNNPLRLILAGIAINAILTSLTRASIIIADDKAFSLINWLSGSLSEIDWQSWSQLWPVSIIALILALTTTRGLNVNALGEETANNLGINIKWMRIRVCIAVLLLTSISVALAGPIVFVGLIIPHIARALFTNNHFILLPASGFLGAALVCWTDFISRTIAPPAETPVGILTALIGTPFFIYLVSKGKR